MKLAAIFLAVILMAGCAVSRYSPNLPRIGGETSTPVRLLATLSEINEKSGRWGKECLPEHLRDRLHDDWPKPLDSVPRWATAYCGEGPQWPDEIPIERRKPIPPVGTETWYHRDIDGSWRPYYAFTSDAGLHFRVGYRWDDVDHYYNFIPPWLATLKYVEVD